MAHGQPRESVLQPANLFGLTAENKFSLFKLVLSMQENQLVYSLKINDFCKKVKLPPTSTAMEELILRPDP